jgi:hypothetical protein
MAVFLYVALALLTIDGVIELGFITSMVHWLNTVAGAGFPISYPDNGQFLLAGKPKNFLVDQGHTSNGAAGSAFIVVGLGGFLALALRHRQLKHHDVLHGFTSFLYNFWLYFSAVAAIYSLAAFVYVFAVTYQHDNQSIDLQFASTLHNEPYPNNVPYPRLTWTPQNWYPAVLQLPLASQSDRDTIKFNLMLMRGWQWNLIPMVILGFVVASLAFVDRMKHRQRLNKQHADSRLEASRQKPGSPWSQ